MAADQVTPTSSCRAPTLSYTKQLESRVAQLENALSKARQADPEIKKVSSPASVAESSSSAGRRIKTEHEDAQELARDFDGLNVETDGRISFHGPTSLFQLPSGVANESGSKLHVAQELEARKERLINSAWRERAFEQMATIPVRASFYVLLGPIYTLPLHFLSFPPIVERGID